MQFFLLAVNPAVDVQIVTNWRTWQWLLPSTALSVTFCEQLQCKVRHWIPYLSSDGRFSYKNITYRRHTVHFSINRRNPQIYFTSVNLQYFVRLTNTVWVLLFTLLVYDSACYFPDVLQLLPHRRVYNISKTFSALLFTQTYITLLIHAAQMCYKDTPSQAVNCMFHNPVILLSVSSVHKHTNTRR
jgi:hypothetical protein